MCLQTYRRRLRIWETDYGRTCGWVIEREGRVIARLTDPQFAEMFWVSYRMEINADDEELQHRLRTKEFWAEAESQELVWRNQEFGEVAESAFPALDPFDDAGRLVVRGLVLPINTPWPWDKFVLWVRRLLRASRS